MITPFNVDLKGKVAVITGGSGILCYPMAKMLAANGAKVAILGIAQDELDMRQKDLTDSGYTSMVINCNVLDKASVEEAHKKVLEQFGPCDILINGAGGNHPKGTTDNEIMELEDRNAGIKTFFDLDVDGFKFVMDLNFIGTLLPSQVFAQDMLEKKGCTIINISSMNAFTPLTKIPAYSGAKAAVSNFTQWLAVHFAHVGIRVNAIAPGFFVTAQNEKLLFNEDGSPSKRSAKILNNTPMNRFGEAQELLGAILFLVDHNSSSFVNGVVLPIDGGFSAFSGV